jgi:tetratricopeptide (TPR) repeat protein
MPAIEKPEPEAQIEAGRRLIEKGNSMRSVGSLALDEALAAYVSAAALIEPLCDSETSPYRDDLASALTNRGIALVGTGGLQETKEAMECFDRAAALRAPLAASGDPWFTFNLVGVLLNRGDAYARMGSPADATETIRSYDEAIRLGQSLDLQNQPDFTRRMALVHLSRGTALAQSSQPESLVEACRSFDASLATLGVANEERDSIAAATWAGKAEALEEQGLYREARACALRAIEVIRPLETRDRDAALVGIKSRLALCANSTRDLLAQNASASQKSEAAEALETAEEGLRVAQLWPSDPAFSTLVRELFRFGSLAYAVLQPRFLLEFIDEYMPLAHPDSVPTFQLIAKDAVSEAIGRLAAKGIIMAGLTGDDLETFGQLRERLEHSDMLVRPNAG